MDDDDVKRNILVSILVLIFGVAFIIVDIFYLGSVIDFLSMCSGVMCDGYFWPPLNRIF